MEKADVHLVLEQLVFNVDAAALYQRDLDARIFQVEIRQDVGQHIGGLGAGKAQPYLAHVAAPQILQLLFHVLLLVEHVFGKGEELHPLRRGAHAGGGPLEDEHAQLLLHLFQILAQGGLGHIQLIRRFGNAVFLRDDNDIAQIVKGHPPSGSFSVKYPQEIPVLNL